MRMTLDFKRPYAVSIITCFVSQIMVEGVKSGPTHEGDMAFDDVHLSDAPCPPHGHCDFERNMCSWSNVGNGVDQEDWLRGRGDSLNPNTGPSVDHTTNSSHGDYTYTTVTCDEIYSMGTSCRLFHVYHD